MPRIPVYEQQIVPSQGLGIPSSQAGAAQAVGRAVESIGEGIGRLRAGMEKREETAGVLWAAKAASEADLAQMEYFNTKKAQAQPGAAGFSEQYLAEFDDFAEKALQNAPNQYGRARLQAHLAQSREMYARNAMAWEAGERARYQGQQIDEGVGVSAKIVMANPELADRELGKWLSTIDSLELEPEARANLREIARKQLAWYSVIGEIDKDPDAWMISPPSSGSWSRLTIDEQLKAQEYARRKSESAVSQRLAEERLAEAEAKRIEREVYAQTSKTGDELLTAGQLSPAWIEANRDNLSQADYRYFHRALRTGEGATNYVKYADLRERAGAGENVADEARAALTDGSIKRADYDRLIGVVESNTVSGVPWYKRGEKYIQSALKPSDLNYDPAAAQRMANAMDDWFAWSASNPKASDREAETEYKRLVSEYGLVNFQEMTLVMRKPSYLVGARNAPDLDATEDATVQAFERGEISPDEFSRQSQLIKQWRDSMEMQSRFSQ